MNTYEAATHNRRHFTVQANTMEGARRIAKRRAWAEFQSGVDYVEIIAVDSVETDETREERRARLQPFRLQHPAAASEGAHWTDHVITEGHVAACAEFGHGTWKINGIIQPRCSRCGVMTAPVVNAAEIEATSHYEAV